MPEDFDKLLRKFCDKIRKEVPEGKIYKSKTTGIRLKWVDRGTQKSFRIYDGALKTIDDKGEFIIPLNVAQQGMRGTSRPGVRPDDEDE